MTLRWERRAPASGPEEVRARHQANRAGWNQGAARYSETLDDTLAFLRAGGSNLHPVERANLGELRSWCRTAVHLQCASGKDTLSLWNEGVARVVGVDISDVHIDNARRLSAALEAPAEWHRCDVLDVPHQLDGSADLVYSGRGALCWIHDLDGWMAVAARVLRPGGVLHVLDDHPVTWLFDADASELSPDPDIDYLEYAEASWGWGPTYIGELGVTAAELAEKHERLWPLSAVVMSAIGAGLAVERLGEHREGYWERFPNLPPDQLRRIPQTFSLLARRPEA
jgi:SAM-dependent methyltransferase